MTEIIMNGKPIETEAMAQVGGGQTNKNPNPGKLDNGIDQIINGENYDALAKRIADLLNPDKPRSRNVDNCVDIYDCEI